MQTFLPYPDFARSAAVLDPLRLGKQRVEALQVQRALRIPGYGWRHHPVVAMWRGYDEALAAYGVAICEGWTADGRADSCLAQIVEPFRGGVRSQDELRLASALPPWLGDTDFHRSHQSALVRKNADWYRRFFPEVSPDLPYVWPVGRTA